jgi:predicted RNA polymerase sigma factor
MTEQLSNAESNLAERRIEARSSYERAPALTQLKPEQRFLEKRLRELDEKK